MNFKDKGVEENRRQTEFEDIINHIPMSLYWKDTDLIYRGGNSFFLKMTGFDNPAELNGKTDYDLHVKESAERFIKEDMLYLSGAKKDISFVDKCVPMKDDTEMWVRTYKIPVFGENGKLKYIMGLIQDITEAKESETELKTSQSRLNTVLNATNDYIAFVDTDGGLITINQSLYTDYIKTDDWRGRKFTEFFSGKFATAATARIRDAFASNTPQFVELAPGNILSDKYYELSIYPVSIDDGIKGAAIFAKDITQKKLAEETLIKHSEELQAAKTEAEKASRSKSEFLSRMSHEIRTPISAIIGMTKIASSSDDINKIKDCLKKIDNSSKQLLGIINDVLDMSKIEAEKFILTPEIFKLESLLKDISDVIGVRASEKKQDFDVYITESMPEFFFADEMRLHQVIINLLTNAVKFTPENGKISLCVANKGIKDGIAAIEMTVADSGIGISAEQQSRLFTPFEQADGGISRKFGGTGLGLAICKKIVEMMGGGIRIESKPGDGSKFIFNVKLKVHYPISEENIKTIKFPDMHALIVDDSYETREYLSQILKRFGVKCDVAEDGFDAIEKLGKQMEQNEPYNIYFVDWSMPGIDGVETTKRIKDIMKQNAVVIMISIYEWDQIEKAATNAGVAKFIPKPLFPSSILNVLDEIAGTSAKTERRVSDFKGVPNLNGYNILLAEDIEINREIALALLSPTGAKIDFAENGIEAVRKFRESKDIYDLILMDVHMPEMDGYEAVKLIRSGSDFISSKIPIVAMTADAFKEDIEKCRAIGMNDHIAKPINENELFKKIIICKEFRRNKLKRENMGASNDDTETMNYLDESEALTRLAGNKNLYVRLLKSFLANNMLAQLDKCLNDGDMKNAEMTAHSIKGVAANLALKHLYNEAVKTDSMLKTGKVEADVIEQFRQSYNDTVEAVTKYIG